MRMALHCWMAVSLASLLIACGGRESGTHAAERGGMTGGAAVPASPEVPVYDLQRGKSVFSSNCLRCHGKGVYDAPRIGNAADWETRVDQPLATLIGHAIHGHGRMPPKGGIAALSNAEVSDAVAYVVDRSKAIILALKRKRNQQDCHPIKAPEKCQGMDAEEVFTLQMLWLLGAPGRQ